MADAQWLDITDIAGTIGFSLSIFANSILLMMIFRKSSPITGAYKKMLIAVCLFTMFYSSVEMLIRPLIHLYDDTLFLIHRKRFDFSKVVARLVATSYCWCYAMSFSLFSLQFLFRYVVMCKMADRLEWCHKTGSNSTRSIKEKSEKTLTELIHVLSKISTKTTLLTMDRHWVTITDITGPIGFYLAIFSNSILLFMVFRKGSPIKGAYKNMLIVFCVFTMFYASEEMMQRPLIHLYDDTLYLIQQKRFDLNRTVTRLIANSNCWCYAMSFTLFALQFLYRYIAVCKPQYVSLFSGHYFFYWLAGVLSIATSWGAAAFLMFPQTNRTTQSFLHIVKESYDLDPYWCDYVGYKYFETDENGVRSVNVLSSLGVIQHAIVMDLSFGTLFYCGIKTYLNIKKHTTVSSKTRDLQHQLFRALVAQTCLPMFLMYIPIGFMFACPYFDWQLGATVNYETVMGHLYPGLDAFVLLVLVDYYRNSILSFILPKYFDHRGRIRDARNEITASTTVKSSSGPVDN